MEALDSTSWTLLRDAAQRCKAERSIRNASPDNKKCPHKWCSMNPFPTRKQYLLIILLSVALTILLCYGPLFIITYLIYINILGIFFPNGAGRRGDAFLLESFFFLFFVFATVMAFVWFFTYTVNFARMRSRSDRKPPIDNPNR